MTIVLTGGGTGGHITPVLAVASELKELRPDIRLVYVGQKGGALTDLPASHPAIDAVYSVRAGKFRRYRSEGWRQLFDFRTQALNLRDALWVLIGIWQSYRLMAKLRPSIIFTRGGYVSVPVALGGRLHGVPYITHDSDSTPSLANRLIARWAVCHAVALPAEVYPYPQQKTVTVGVPTNRSFVPVNTKLQRSYRKALGVDNDRRMLFVTGGGNGAAWLNSAVAQAVPALMKEYPDLFVVHAAGRKHEASLRARYERLLDASQRRRVVVKGFVNNLHEYSGAADVIVARGGASGLAEFAVQGKACLVIPARQLSWQVHHADTLARRGAVMVLHEQDALAHNRLEKTIAGLLGNRSERERLGAELSKLARPDAAKEIAMLLLEQISDQ